MELDWSVQVRSYPGAPRGGDIGLVVATQDGALAALIDASGHGLAAYSVAQQARNTILTAADLSPEDCLTALHQALSGGIGAAASIARIRNETIEFAGVGNVSAYVGESALVVRPGVVGIRMRPPHVTRCAFPVGTWLVMHTDGVSRPESVPEGSAQSAARAIVEAYGTDRDDSGVLLLRVRGMG